MKKRLRKKFHKGEFKEVGFEISFIIDNNISEADFDKFLDNFIDIVEVNDLCFSGGGSKDNWSGIISKEKKYLCTDESDKLYILNWLKTRKELVEPKIGKDIDLWYPPDDFLE